MRLLPPGQYIPLLALRLHRGKAVHGPTANGYDGRVNLFDAHAVQRVSMESDEELLERIGRGDRGAFDVFHARYREAIRRHVGRIIPDAAEDVAQEAFLRVWRKAGQWERRGSARGWVYRIATNLSLNLLESRRRAGLVSAPCVGDEEETDDLLSRVADAPERGPAELLERRDRLRLVRESVGKLPERKRRVMDSYLDGTGTLAEIALDLGLPLGTVKSRFFYASRELRELLEDRDEWRDT